MGTWLDRVGELARDAGVSAMFLFSLAVVAMVGCRQPSRRSAIARGSILAALGAALLSLVGPFPRIDPVAECRQAGLWPRAPLASLVTGSSGAHPTRPREGARSPDRFWRGITLLYVGCVGIGTSSLLLGLAGVRWLVARARPPAAKTLACYERVSAATRGRRPRLLISDRVKGPVLAGVVRPVILVPEDLENSAANDALGLCLAHELAHAEGRDPWFSMLGAVAHTLWFFVPPLWWVRSQMRLDRELIADARAACEHGQVGHYAASLLELSAAESARERSRTAAQGEADAHSSLSRRVLMLVRSPFPVEITPPSWWCPTAYGLFAVLGLGLSCCTWPSLPQPVSAAPPAAGRATPPRAFHVRRLELPPSGLTPNGRAIPYELPIRVPAEFFLSLEVWADPRSLTGFRIIGHPLLRTEDLAMGGRQAESWHSVTIRRGPNRFELTIDDRTRSLEGDGYGTSAWLSIEPGADRPGMIRNLRLSW